MAELPETSAKKVTPEILPIRSERNRLHEQTPEDKPNKATPSPIGCAGSSMTGAQLDANVAPDGSPEDISIAVPFDKNKTDLIAAAKEIITTAKDKAQEKLNAIKLAEIQ